MGELFVISLFVGVLLFLFPVFVHTDIYVDIRENKANFCIRVFHLIKVAGGYIQLKSDGIVIHLSKKKAVFFSFEKMKPSRRFQISDGFQLYKFHQIIETGGSQTIWGIMVASALQSLGGAAIGILKTKYPYLSLKNGTVLAEEPCLKYSAQIVIILNGLVIMIAVIKKILEVIINWIRKKRLTAFSKKQRSN